MVPVVGGYHNKTKLTPFRVENITFWTLNKPYLSKVGYPLRQLLELKITVFVTGSPLLCSLIIELSYIFVDVHA